VKIFKLAPGDLQNKLPDFLIMHIKRVRFCLTCEILSHTIYIAIMSVHSRIDKTLDKLLDVSSIINHLGQNITFPKLAVAQARISGRAEGKEQGSLEMAELVCDRLIPDLETRANESLRLLGEEFVSTLGKSGIGGIMVRDKKTGLPIKIHPMIKEIFPDKGGPLYYHGINLSKKTGQHGAKLKKPEKTWSTDADKSVDPGMTQEEWE